MKKLINKSKSILLIYLTCCITLLFPTTTSAEELLGAGATFPFPLYAKMFDHYAKEFKVKVNYQAIGSGGGIRQLKNKTVNFGASDAYINDKDLKKMNGNVVHVPICLGAVSLSFNLPGIKEIKLTPEIIEGIFLGKIRKWNDKKITALNPKVKLPKLPVMVVHRSDGSGTTFIFTDYLAKISPKWAKKIGRGKAVKWVVGMGGKGNAGVAGLIKQIPGSIGYIEMVYALQNNMPVAVIQNKAGNFIKPSVEATTFAAATTIPEDTRVSITNTDAKYGYPISGFTWVLVYADMEINNKSRDKALAVKNLLKWMVTKGQGFAQPLGYAPLPKNVVKKAKKQIKKIKFNNKVLSYL